MRGCCFFYIVFVFATSCFSSYANSSENIVLTSQLAQKMAMKAIEYGKKHGWTLSVSIVNSEGNLIHFQRDNGAYVGSIEASIDKAKSANAFRRSTSVFVEGVKSGKLGLLSVRGVIANEGGVPITIGEKVVGAIGISGAKSTEDEEAAKAAIQMLSEKST